VSKPDLSGRATDLTAELRLRPQPPTVTRLSRKVLMALATLAAITVSAAVMWALHQGRPKGSGGELYNTENKTTPDGLATLPRDYTGAPPTVPVLGPPLPGDLGRSILNAQTPGLGPTAVDPEHQRLAQESEAARTSHLFATTNTRERSVVSSASPVLPTHHLIMSPKPVRSFPPRLSPGSGLICRDKSPPRSPKMSTTARPAGFC
jgi:type IV secretion system protein TrbI